MVLLQSYVFDTFRLRIYVKFGFLSVIIVLNESLPLFSVRLLSFNEVRQIWRDHGDYLLNAKLFHQLSDVVAMLLIFLSTN